MNFVHLHLHTQYSILDGLTNIKQLFARARELGMPAVAITDHGNMYGVKEFLKHAFDKSNLDKDGKPIVKPIIGCEVYVTRHYPMTLRDNDHKKYYHLILLAKNYEGYRNLMKICSAGHMDGMYYKPRVDHKTIEKYSKGLVCSSACLAGEIARNINDGDFEAAREAVRWHKSVFGEDYYLEVMLHRTEVPGVSLDVYEQQKTANEGIFRLAREEGVKVVATNDVHFLRKEDGKVHDHLICLTTNENIDSPDRLRYTQQEYLKTAEEMAELFPDNPEVLGNTLEVAGKVEAFKIDREPILPKFDIDPEFVGQKDLYLEKYKDVIDAGRCDHNGTYRGDDFCLSVAFLCHLTYEGAIRRYGSALTEEQLERIDFELKTICKMGFPDYFLIVQDYIAASRKMGYMVGPGRGSAAGSVVAYCLGITNLDPLTYNLLFERFLNPDRVNMPDIDVDFENLPAAHQYIEEKYGEDHVARVITYGTMLAKGAIKDVARIRKLPIFEANELTKLVPDRLSEKKEMKYPFNPQLDELKPGFKKVEENGVFFQKGMEDQDVKVTLENCFRLVPEFQEILRSGSDEVKEILNMAQRLEGSIRQTGQHACATIIGRGDLREYIPVCLSTDKETGRPVQTSQFDGHYIEDVGMLKMDFLGLNTLSIIHATLDNIKQRHGLDIDIEAIPKDDPLTYELYGRGDTTIVFQFESPGMKKWLQKLHPERFEDLIAMNALYRPGPMDYIPEFVERKLGHQKIEYDLPQMEEYLAETYGVTVYQEQVMLLSRKLANFTKGEADKLRKAMGKKQIAVMQELKEKFISNGQANGHPEKVLDKIWKDWEKFAQYAFNKSHATCYAWISYQTGWLKAHYPSEFFAANLSCNLDSMDEIKKIMDECRLHGVKVLSPDVNESQNTFSVNREGHIRYGLGGLKGFGANVVDAILGERSAGGPFKDVYDFVERMAEQSIRQDKTPSVNRKSLETLVNAGAFDSFGLKRSQFFCTMPNGELFLDELAHYAELYKADKQEGAVSLFGDAEEFKPVRPEMPEAPATEDVFENLLKEKEIVGMYISSHPLDKYRYELEHFTTCSVAEIRAKEEECTATQKSCKLSVAGIVTEVNSSTSKTGNPIVRAKIEDFKGSCEIALFGKDVDSFKQFVELHAFVFIEGEIKARYIPKREDGAKPGPVEHSFRIGRMMSLGNVTEEFVKEYRIRVRSSQLTPQFRKKLAAALKDCPGKTPLIISLYDEKNDWTVDLVSKQYSVKVCSDLVDRLSEIGVAL